MSILSFNPASNIVNLQYHYQFRHPCYLPTCQSYHSIEPSRPDSCRGTRLQFVSPRLPIPPPGQKKCYLPTCQSYHSIQRRTISSRQLSGHTPSIRQPASTNSATRAKNYYLPPCQSYHSIQRRTISSRHLSGHTPSIRQPASTIPPLFIEALA